jgi:hypothetical protein
VGHVPRDPQPVLGGAGKIVALCERLDKYGDYLRADFQQLYGLNVDDVWTGALDPGHALALAEQLKLDPNSRVRAIWLGTVEYVGWGPMQHALANLYDLIASGFYSIGGKKLPSKARYPRPTPPPQEASSIKDFNVELFMRRLSG